MIAQSKFLDVILTIVPGPEFADTRQVRSFSFTPNIVGLEFTVEHILLLPETNKVIFYSQTHLGEIFLDDYPFQDTSQTYYPTIKIHRAHVPNRDNNLDTDNPDDSTQSKLM